jgi:hypothetical protein
MKASELLKNTDSKRTEKGKYDVKRTTNILKGLDGKEQKVVRLEYTNRSEKFNTEHRTHAGFVEYIPSSGKDPEITSIFCDCADFYIRLIYFFNKAGMCPWDLPAKFKGRENLRAKANGEMFRHHNKQKPKFDWTNKAGNLYLCKHLVNVIFYYIAEISDKELDKQVKLANKSNISKNIKDKGPIAQDTLKQKSSSEKSEISKKDNLSDKSKIATKDDKKIKDKEKTIQKSMTPKSDKSSSEKSEVKPAQKLSKTSDEKAKPISNIKKTITTTKQTPKVIPNVKKEIKK